MTLQVSLYTRFPQIVVFRPNVIRIEKNAISGKRVYKDICNLIEYIRYGLTCEKGFEIITRVQKYHINVG